MKAVVAAFNQEKALVGAFSVITNLRMELFEALVGIYKYSIPINEEKTWKPGDAQMHILVHSYLYLLIFLESNNSITGQISFYAFSKLCHSNIRIFYIPISM